MIGKIVVWSTGVRKPGNAWVGELAAWYNWEIVKNDVKPQSINQSIIELISLSALITNKTFIMTSLYFLWPAFWPWHWWLFIYLLDFWDITNMHSVSNYPCNLYLFPHVDAFWHICSRRLLKLLWHTWRLLILKKIVPYVTMFSTDDFLDNCGIRGDCLLWIKFSLMWQCFQPYSIIQLSFIQIVQLFATKFSNLQ